MKENSYTFWYSKEEPEHTRKIIEVFGNILKINEKNEKLKKFIGKIKRNQILNRDGFQTFEEILVFYFDPKPIGSQMNSSETIYAISEWDQDGLPYGTIIVDETEKAKITLSSCSTYLYALPSFITGDFRYFSCQVDTEVVNSYQGLIFFIKEIKPVQKQENQIEKEKQIEEEDGDDFKIESKTFSNCYLEELCSPKSPFMFSNSFDEFDEEEQEDENDQEEDKEQEEDNDQEEEEEEEQEEREEEEEQEEEEEEQEKSEEEEVQQKEFKEIETFNFRIQVLGKGL